MVSIERRRRNTTKKLGIFVLSIIIVCKCPSGAIDRPWSHPSVVSMISSIRFPPSITWLLIFLVVLYTARALVISVSLLVYSNIIHFVYYYLVHISLYINLVINDRFDNVILSISVGVVCSETGASINSHLGQIGAGDGQISCNSQRLLYFFKETYSQHDTIIYVSNYCYQ